GKLMGGTFDKALRLRGDAEYAGFAWLERDRLVGGVRARCWVLKAQPFWLQLSSPLADAWSVDRVEVWV
ncbi:hypothetical protein, partial [Microbacterium indicum]|uniref:hypothetical protein n=1 Tax=Microbacterium indicum TaxID=358100 RepID=UPI001B7F9374